MRHSAPSRLRTNGCTCGQNLAERGLTKDEKRQDQRERNGHTFGTFAAKAGCHACVFHLLQNNNHPNLSMNHNGSTMLHYGALNGRPTVVNLLCKYGADVNLPNKRLRTALHEAATTGHAEVVKLLLTNGADVLKKNKYGRTSLHVATKYNNRSVISLLVQHRQRELLGVLKECECLTLHDSLIQLVVEFTCNTADQNDECFCAQDLEDNDIRQDFKIPRNEHGHTVATKAAVSGCVKCCNWLIKCGLDINIPETNDGSCMLYCAVYKQRLACVKLLCEKGANVNARNSRDRLSISNAVTNGRADIVDILCEAGADLSDMGPHMPSSPEVTTILEYHRDLRRLLAHLHNHVHQQIDILLGDDRSHQPVMARFRVGMNQIVQHEMFTTSLTSDEKLERKLSAKIKELEQFVFEKHKERWMHEEPAETFESGPDIQRTQTTSMDISE